MAPPTVPELLVPTLELPPARGAERPGSKRRQLALEDGQAAPLLPRPRLRGHQLREAGEPDAAALLRRVAQGEELVAGAGRRQQPRVLLGDPALHLHSHGDLRLLQHQLPIAERDTIKVLSGIHCSF